MYCIRVKEILNCRRNTIYLGKSTNAKQSNSSPEKCKNLGKPSPLFAHTIFDIIKWASKYMSIFIDGSIFDCQQAFRILCCHSEECSYDHPEQSSRSSCCNCSGNTYNIPCTNGCRQCCAKGSKAGNFTFAAFFIFYHEFQGFSQMPYL